ncbi:MAG: STAS domain-containing protein [Spirochaetaceae bacterium]|nr:STAS domain-containing protein [Spirochaetaceae bacterium]
MSNDDLVSGFDSSQDESLKIVLSNDEGISEGLVIQLIGYIDTYNSPFFQEQLSKVIEAGYINLVFNCENLNYVSSTGIGVFSFLLKTLKSKAGDIVLYGLQTTVSEVFQLLGFSQLFNIKTSFEEAKAYFHKEQQSSVSVFPKVFSCPVCSKRLRASCAGRFRCSECKSVIAVDGHGQVQLG